MSRTDDYGLSDSGRDRQDRSPSVQDRTAEPPSRLGMSREAARVEMERFRGVAEYETRKIFGQRSALRQPVEVPAPKTKKRKSVPTQRATSSVRREVPKSSVAGDALGTEDSPEHLGSVTDHQESGRRQ